MSMAASIAALRLHTAPPHLEADSARTSSVLTLWRALVSDRSFSTPVAAMSGDPSKLECYPYFLV
jgi:hypothetical protein